VRVAIVLAAIAALAHGQQQKRDLTVKEVAEPPKTTQRSTPPRSYALIVGIAKYQNLAAKDNLQFSERDADRSTRS
jgi:hypothetical protein